MQWLEEEDTEDEVLHDTVPPVLTALGAAYVVLIPYGRIDSR